MHPGYDALKEPPINIDTDILLPYSWRGWTSLNHHVPPPWRLCADRQHDINIIADCCYFYSAGLSLECIASSSCWKMQYRPGAALASLDLFGVEILWRCLPVPPTTDLLEGAWSSHNLPVQTIFHSVGLFKGVWSSHHVCRLRRYGAFLKTFRAVITSLSKRLIMAVSPATRAYSIKYRDSYRFQRSPSALDHVLFCWHWLARVSSEGVDIVVLLRCLFTESSFSCPRSCIKRCNRRGSLYDGIL